MELFFFNAFFVVLTKEETGKVMRERKAAEEAKITHC